MLLYVDDILFIDLKKGIARVKKIIFKFFKMKNSGFASLYLGVEINHLLGGAIKLFQIHYIERILKRFGLENCNGVKLPMKRDIQECPEDPILALKDITTY